jgi:hypothetical protein
VWISQTTQLNPLNISYARTERMTALPATTGWTPVAMTLLGVMPSIRSQRLPLLSVRQKPLVCEPHSQLELVPKKKIT